MKRTLLSLVFIISLLFSLSGSISSAQAGITMTSTDLDQDGILNNAEINGWYNLTGGPYKTNPGKADSDQDGLTDAEEKLFNTNPNDLTNPGISVKYDKAFKTFEYYSTSDPKYFSILQGGDRYLIVGDNTADHENGLVVRRGSSFTISAINASTATLSITGSGMTAITPARDHARGGWKVTIPPNGTVGAYTATITNGAWSKSMPIYVIFALPTDLTQAQIDAYVYDDDPVNKRDEVAVWWRADYYAFYNNYSPTPTTCAPGDEVCSNWPYHASYGYAQAFWTEQFTTQVFKNHTIPAIQGRTSTYSATQGIATKADESVRVNYSSAYNSFTGATYYYYSANEGGYVTTGGACETNAGVFTALLRSAGIPAKPFVMNYNKLVGPHGENGNTGAYEYDHAVMIWTRAQGDSGSRWYAERTSAGGEPRANPIEPIWSLGYTTGMRPFDQIGEYNPNNILDGFGKFRDLFADAVLSANEGWDWQVGSNSGGMVNSVWPIPNEEKSNSLNRDFKWDSKYPLSMDHQSPYVDLFNCQIWLNDQWAPIEWMDPTQSNPADRTARQTYWLPLGVGDPGEIENWPYNPKPLACSPSSTDDAACAPFLARMAAQAHPITGACVPLPGQVFGSAPAPVISQAPILNQAADIIVQLGEIVGESGVDQDGDGLFDMLAIQVEVTSDQPGQFQIGGWLHVGDAEIRAETTVVSLVQGAQVVEVTFDGQLIGDANMDGPYTVEEIWLAPAGQAVSQLALPEEMAAQQAYAYASQPYVAADFTVQEASISESITFAATDNNLNGLIDSIAISVPLNVNIPGVFKLQGDLYDGLGTFLGHAEWVGDASEALLEFQIAKSQPPYSLEHLVLQNGIGKQLDARYAPIFKVEQLDGAVELGSISFSNGASESVLQTIAITPTNPFTVAPSDTNGNGRSDKLIVSAVVDVTGQGGTYWMEGLFVDDRGIPAAWGVGDPTVLNVGAGQTLQMAFDGRQIYDHLPLVNGQSFTLTAVKIFSGTPAQAVLEAQVPITSFVTPVYTRSLMDSPYVNVIFADDMESGGSKWSVTGSWAITTNEWNTTSHAYWGSGTGRLTLATPLNLMDYSGSNGIMLQFRHTYTIGSGDQALLQISTNGTDWTDLKTYSGMTGYWTTEQIDLSDYKGFDEVKLRFNIPASSTRWYVDDVIMVVGSFAVYLPVTIR